MKLAKTWFISSVITAFVFLSGCTNAEKPDTSSGKPPLKVCTLIGCSNSVKVKLPEYLSKVPGSYSMNLFLGADPVRKYRVDVTDKSIKACPDGDKITALKKLEGDHVFLSPMTKVCKTPRSNGGNVYGEFAGFTVVNTKQPSSVKIEVLNAGGKMIFQQAISLQPQDFKKFEPNGPGCGECFQKTIDFR